MIICYTGLPGGGKSLSAIADYVLPELRRGRHVFCNIVGIDPLMVAFKLTASMSVNGNAVTTSYVNRYLHRFSISFNDVILNSSFVFLFTLSLLECFI